MNGKLRLKDNPFLYILIVKWCTNFIYITAFVLVALTLLTGYLLITPTIIACCVVCGFIESYTNRLIEKHETILKDIMDSFFIE